MDIVNAFPATCRSCSLLGRYPMSRSAPLTVEDEFGIPVDLKLPQKSGKYCHRALLMN
jgi:hypothetical protein